MRPTTHHRFFTAGLFALAMITHGCATSRPVEAVLPAVAEAPLRAAAELGAANVPTAALHASYARDELEAARAAAKDGEQRRAHLLSRRAQLDAELALLITRRSTAVSEANAALMKGTPPIEGNGSSN